MQFELMIDNGKDILVPLVADGTTWTTDRKGAPGKLTFTVLKDSILDFHEGNNVALTVDGQPIFYGFVFTKKRDKRHHIAVTAYDQLRYLTNKDTMMYKNLTASGVIRVIAEDYRLSLGTIEETEFRIADRVEDNSSLFDIIYNALDLELTNKGKMYVLYDDFGKLTLKSLDSMKVNLLLDDETGENFDYSSSIDSDTYNRIKLSYDNKDTGKRDIYVAQDGSRINDWGVLQLYETLQEGENGAAKADALLDLYNVKTRKLKVIKAFGDVRIRAGCMVIVKLGVGDMNVQNYMLIEKCVHTFNAGEHWMDLTLRGGEYIG